MYASKVMFLIYVYANCNIHRKYNKTIEQNRCLTSKHYFSTIRTTGNALSPEIENNLHGTLVKNSR